MRVECDFNLQIENCICTGSVLAVPVYAGQKEDNINRRASTVSLCFAGLSVHMADFDQSALNTVLIDTSSDLHF